MKVFFSHIPKTGGSSVQTFFRNAVNNDLIAPFPTDGDAFIAATESVDLARYDYFFAHVPLYLRQILPTPIFTVTWLRDPLDRAISAYNHLLRDERHPKHELLMSETRDFGDFLRHPELGGHALEAYTRYFGNDLNLLHYRERSEASVGNRGVANTMPDQHTFARARERMRTIDFIGFCDRMEYDCRRLARRLGLKAEFFSPLENVDPQQPTKRPRPTRTPELQRLFSKLSPFDHMLYQAARNVNEGRVFDLVLDRQSAR